MRKLTFAATALTCSASMLSSWVGGQSEPLHALLSEDFLPTARSPKTLPSVTPAAPAPMAAHPIRRVVSALDPGEVGGETGATWTPPSAHDRAVVATWGTALKMISRRTRSPSLRTSRSTMGVTPVTPMANVCCPGLTGTGVPSSAPSSATPSMTSDAPAISPAPASFGTKTTVGSARPTA
jgi:hypothetical protein